MRNRLHFLTKMLTFNSVEPLSCRKLKKTQSPKNPKHTKLNNMLYWVKVKKVKLL